MRPVIILAILFAIPVIGFSATYYVPDDFPTIQGAISDASVVDGDTIIVRAGTYVENIDFLGKAITVKSEQGPDVTTIDGGDPSIPEYGSVVTFSSGEGVDSLLEGFTLTNGQGTWNGGDGKLGGGVFCDGSSPTIKNNIIAENSVGAAGPGYGEGGGIFCWESSPTVMDNIIIGNIACGGSSGGGTGGGIYIWDGDPVITNNFIAGNETTGGAPGGGISCWSAFPTITKNSITGNTSDYGGGIFYDQFSSPTIMNNTIIWNTAYVSGGGIYGSGTIVNNMIINNSASFGGGIYADGGSSSNMINNTICGNQSEYIGGGVYCSSPFLTIINTILWNNQAGSTRQEIRVRECTLTISFSDVDGGVTSISLDDFSTLNWGPGMIDADPLFVAGPKGFLYLSQIAAGQLTDSPCVDTGSDLANNLGMDIYWTRTDEVPDSGTVDMGYHYGPFIYPALQIDTFSMQESTGGTANYLLLAGADNASRNYLLLGSLTGTTPGTILPDGTSLPINLGAFTNFILLFLNGSVFQNFLGTLDTSGSSTATFDTQGSMPPGMAGTTMSFAYCLPYRDPDGWFASNPVSIEIVP